ncbi:putative Transmembrane protein [Quillaja saponaria]|uniref:Transmembrane protein n=1 Tax=Quillaja saponaria TaxID=32244 RepID=A0AAD7M3T9_QUISA|nr:putative Transmembrane protein [Quillaja saponaria]
MFAQTRKKRISSFSSTFSQFPTMKSNLPMTKLWMGGQKKKKKKIDYRAGWDFDGNEMMGLIDSQKPGIDLMQNCDLPPPSKVFMGSDKMVILSMNKVCSTIGKAQDHKEFATYTDGDHDKLEILKALRSSQTRAREAEKKAEILAKEKVRLSNALMEEAMQSFAYRQQVRLLELQVSKLQSQWLQRQQPTRPGCIKPKEENDDEDRPI